MLRLIRALMLLVVAGTTIGCAQIFYDKTGTATVKGDIQLYYRQPNVFLYVPTRGNPLTFTPSKGGVVTPGPMMTNGGSVPRLFWSIPNFGPWDYGYAYVIHDWLFNAKHCGDKSVSFEDSARYLAEAMKQEMVKRNEPRPDVLWAVHEAVASGIARELWDSDGLCDQSVVEAHVREIEEERKPSPLFAVKARKYQPVGTLACADGTCKLVSP